MLKEPMQIPMGAKRTIPDSGTYALCASCGVWPAPRYVEERQRFCEECYVESKKGR